MPAFERPGDRAAISIDRDLATIGREIRIARIGYGLSQDRVARAAGMSQSHLSRFERGRGRVSRPDRIARACAAVGLDLSLRAFPAGRPIRDRAHVELLGRLRSLASRTITWTNEVPLPIPGDRRAWDSVGMLPAEASRCRIHVDAETRLYDVQSVLRRVALKKRDSGDVRVTLVVADSRGNRAALRAAANLVAEHFPIPGRVALVALQEARDPGGDSLVLI